MGRLALISISAVLFWSISGLTGIVTGDPQVKPVMHPFFVSVTEMHYNKTEASLEISCKLFTDDFENALKNQYKTKVDLQEIKAKQIADKYVSDYMQKHLQLSVNGKAVALQFLGFEVESEAVWCYFEVKQVPAVKTIEVMNNLLYESHDTQIGIIHAVVAGNRKSTQLVNPAKQATFNF